MENKLKVYSNKLEKIYYTVYKISLKLDKINKALDKENYDASSIYDDLVKMNEQLIALSEKYLKYYQKLEKLEHDSSDIGYQMDKNKATGYGLCISETHKEIQSLFIKNKNCIKNKFRKFMDQ